MLRYRATRYPSVGFRRQSLAEILMSEFDPVDDLDETEIELWTQMNLVPADTGLPMTIWVHPRSNERHSARIKVCSVHGPRMLPDHLVTVVLHPRRVIPPGGLSADDLRAVNA